MPTSLAAIVLSGAILVSADQDSDSVSYTLNEPYQRSARLGLVAFQSRYKLAEGQF